MSSSNSSSANHAIGTQSATIDGDLGNDKISESQHAFILQVVATLKKPGATKQIWHHPPSPLNTFIPTAASYYVRPVVCWWPHLLFPGVELKCPKTGCLSGRPLKPKGVVPPRYIHGMESGVYLSQYNYICETCNTKTTAMDVVLPGGLNFLCPVSLTHKSGFTRDVQTFITSAATTGMSFSEMGKHMATLRLTKYLDSFAEFKIRLKYYLESAQSIISSSSQQTAVCPEFSSFDDNTGYNETVQPTDQYLQRLFTDFVEKNVDFIERTEELTVICPVIKTDHTFNVAERSSHGKSSSLLITMGGDGQILSKDWVPNTGSKLN